MKTLVVLSALAAIAIAGPTIPGDESTDFNVTKIGKRSPTPHKGHAQIVAPVHSVPMIQHVPMVHHSYMQPVISHHHGLKKPLLFNHGHHGHHGHLLRTEGEEVEAHSAESKETKAKCMKDMEAKCDDEIIAKSSELTDGAQIEDIEDNISEGEVAQSLQMAKEAVNALQRNLQRAEQNSRMTQWKQGNLESDVKLQREVETAKQALDQMQLKFGNLESMNVQMRSSAFKEADVQNTHLELTKSEQERIAQWKDAIENIEKNVELVKNIEDSFQHAEHSEMKSAAALENSTTLKQAKSEDQKPSLTAATHKEQVGLSKDASETRIDGKSAGNKSSWKALAHERSANIESSHLESDMETSASTLSESNAALHSANDHHEQSARNEHAQSFVKSHNENHSGKGSQGLVQSQTNLGTSHNHHQSSSSHNQHQLSSSHNHHQLSSSPNHHQSSSHNAMKLALGHGNVENSRDDEHSMMLAGGKISDKQVGLSSQLVKTPKSSEGSKFNLDHEKSVPVIDTTNLMKSADRQMQAEVIDNSKKLEKSSLKTEASKFEDSNLKHVEIEANISEKPINFDISEASKSPSIDNSLSSHGQGKSTENEMVMKSSDQMAGQSQQSEVATMAVQHMPAGHQLEKSKQLNSFGVHGKSVDGVSDSVSLQTSPDGLHSSFKSSVDVPKSKSWKDASIHGSSSRGAYGSGLSLGGGYGASGYGASGYGAGASSSAVGVFPSAHVGGCAIPLLLSCSPNVVAGHLAKTHSSYSAPSYASPSYRNSETTTTHSKRDITKIASPTKVKRTPTRNLKQKSILITDRL